MCCYQDQLKKEALLGLDVIVANRSIRPIPHCMEPSDLTASAVTPISSTYTPFSSLTSDFKLHYHMLRSLSKSTADPGFPTELSGSVSCVVDVCGYKQSSLL
ncbi:hypothetical protein SK128_012235 [Halocaridina rubra]|uniref:Uncharacterized protein n=1 Tax=Halocaridina rubra TaxID=373956 RepID=A0AAN8XH85_HALRR